MPLYEYECADHGVFDVSVSMNARAAPQSCPDCGRPAPRVFATAVAVAAMPAAARAAHRINEKSQHQPKTSGQLRHGSGCGCCGGASRITTRKATAPRRPWMIGH